jgi:hypothetical protein
MHRTTVMLDDDLYREVKRTAVDRGRPMRALMEEALSIYLHRAPGRTKAALPKFGVYPARVHGALRREDIYGEYLARKMR